ncbi:succinate dehydrogenase iron-sulfur subunit [Hippea jasoniae]|uniref:succinate dehydrogenase iron-sulfur subunit n=1 Tax=Hippea jasoniae TaxID=944479 RepID=UPI00055238C1|nr:succinate dehydrogenase iron-sulfur subunit [Hippea jasoniae]
MALNVGDKVIFKIFRYDPEKDKAPYFKDYEVTITRKGMMVLDGLNQIKWEQDPTLTYRRSCREGVCGSDGMNINGVNTVSCMSHIEDYNSDVLVIKPLPGFPIIKDLVCDFEDFFNKYYTVKPYLIEKVPPPGRERLQSIEDRNKLNGLYECILCGCCSSSCPSYWADPDYLGPSALLNAARFVFDTRDEGDDERLDIVNSVHGVWRCHTILNCITACPKELNPTKAIGMLQKEILKRKY